MLLTDDEISDIYEQPSKTPREFARAIEQAVIAKLREQKPVALPFAILDEEIKDLHRFHECVSDGEGYDVPKERMMRLAEIGLVRRVTANVYEHTTFGLSVINGDFTHPAPIPEGWKELMIRAISRMRAAHVPCADLERIAEAMLAAARSRE